MQDANGRLEAEVLRLGVEYSFPVKVGSFTIRMRPLSNSEMLQCHAAVDAHIQQLPKSAQSDLTRSTHLAREFLHAASSPFGNYNPQLPHETMEKMTNGQIMALYKEWMSITDKCNPELEKIDEETLKGLVEDIKKNPPADLDSQLTELSFGQLRNLVSYLLTKGD